jgi:glycosyltransferase involved in cell wall biosynthesis
MKILIQSVVFSPSIGGTETATRLLAIGLNELGHEVKIVTDTKEYAPQLEGIEVHRDISRSKYLQLVGWCDIFIHSNISLRNVWPLLIHRKPWVIIHHTRIEAVEGEYSLVSRIKQWVIRYATNLSVSKFMADNLHYPSIVVKNPYGDDTFRVESGAVQDRELIVVGRFLKDKGFQVAIEALAKLRQRGFANTKMTMVGDGPYREELDDLTRRRGLQSAIKFTGIKPPQELAQLFNRHKILIVPSLTPETFGLVAVEGVACGCFVIGSDVGSLKDTIGPCGVTFKAGDADSLANLVQSHLEHPEAQKPYAQAAATHLSQFERAKIIPFIADCLEDALAKWKERS